MTTTISLDGVIGWDVTAAEVRAALPKEGEAELRINSPGGDVHEGIAIANALRQFRRDGGRISAVITGVAASMASYIATFADEVAVEDNAVWMAHNPWSVAAGDYQVMAKASAILASIRGILARAYAARTGRDQDVILDEMDDETWLFGAEIAEAGYADRVVPAGDGPEDRVDAMALARAGFAAMRGKIKEREADAAQLDRIAALVPLVADSSAPTPKQEPSMADTTQVADETTAEQTTIDTAAIAAAAAADERKRVAGILRACAAARMPERAQAMIEDGTSVDRAREVLIDALAERSGPEMRHTPDTAPPDDFQAMVAARVAGGMSRGQALRATILEHPELHRAWLASIQH